MREIKFRAWDDQYQDMEYSHDIDRINANDNNKGFTLSEFFEFNHKLPWMQYIGRIDSTGKEIYEGDIISVEDARDGFPYSGGVIEYDSDHARYAVKISNGYYPISNFRRITVIGNIYENPNLIK